MGVLSLVLVFVICFLLVFVMLSRLLIAALWSPAGKGLTSWLQFVMSSCDLVTFCCGILGQVWYLIVLIPGLCSLSQFKYCTENKNMLVLVDLCAIHVHLLFSSHFKNWTRHENL